MPEPSFRENGRMKSRFRFQIFSYPYFPAKSAVADINVPGFAYPASKAAPEPEPIILIYLLESTSKEGLSWLHSGKNYST